MTVADRKIIASLKKYFKKIRLEKYACTDDFYLQPI